jgi:hypothetical protein
LVTGMQMPPNYGRKYGEDFSALFASAASSATASREATIARTADAIRAISSRCAEPATGRRS